MIRACLRALLLLLTFAANAKGSGLDQLSPQFLDSDFIFSSTQTNVPCVPLAWLDASSYQDSDIHGREFRQTSLSEATLVPFLVGRRDALLIGQWGTWTRL